MKRKGYKKPLFIILLLMIVEISCGASPADRDFTQADKIIYKFRDASVPPEHHRSYIITITAHRATIKVDSYGDILREKSVTIKENQFKSLIKVIKSKIENQKEKENNGCTGGTTEYIAIYSGKKSLLKAHVYHCGGDDYGTLKGDSGAVAKEIKKLFEDFKGIVGK